MLPQVILTAVAGILNAISRLISAGDDQAAQEEALMLADEELKRALDHFKFMPYGPDTVREPGGAE